MARGSAYYSDRVVRGNNHPRTTYIYVISNINFEHGQTFGYGLYHESAIGGNCNVYNLLITWRNHHPHFPRSELQTNNGSVIEILFLDYVRTLCPSITDGPRNRSKGGGTDGATPLSATSAVLHRVVSIPAFVLGELICSHCRLLRTRRSHRMSAYNA